MTFYTVCRTFQYLIMSNIENQSCFKINGIWCSTTSNKYFMIFFLFCFYVTCTTLSGCRLNYWHCRVLLKLLLILISKKGELFTYVCIGSFQNIIQIWREIRVHFGDMYNYIKNTTFRNIMKRICDTDSTEYFYDLFSHIYTVRRIKVRNNLSSFFLRLHFLPYLILFGILGMLHFH
jgi:hypothetical protein